MTIADFLKKLSPGNVISKFWIGGENQSWLSQNARIGHIKKLAEAVQESIDAIPTPEPVDSRPYRVYTALLRQSGSGAPIATVLENTLGFEPTFSRQFDGEYLIETEDATGFIVGQTVVFLQQIGSLSGERLVYFQHFNRVDQIEFMTTNLAGTPADGLLSSNGTNVYSNTPIEIRIYDNASSLYE